MDPLIRILIITQIKAIPFENFPFIVRDLFQSQVFISDNGF